MERILIACIGNIFLGDDAFGVEVARAFSAEALPDGVKLVDYGIRGLDLAYALLEPWRAVVLVDAVTRGGEPGTLYLLRPENTPSDGVETTVDAHSMDPMRIMAMARSLGEIHAEVYIVGCEPLDFGDELEGRMGLSSEVAAAVPEAGGMIANLIEKLTEATVPV